MVRVAKRAHKCRFTRNAMEIKIRGQGTCNNAHLVEAGPVLSRVGRVAWWDIRCALTIGGRFSVGSLVDGSHFDRLTRKLPPHIRKMPRRGYFACLTWVNSVSIMLNNISTMAQQSEQRKLVALRMLPTVHRQAKIAAVVAGKTLGQWVEEAVKEKIKREANNE